MSTARERTRAAQGKAEKVGWPTFKVNVGGEEVIVDPNTFTGKERQLMKRELATLGYEADGEDRTYASIWLTMRRVNPLLTFDDVLEKVTALDYLESATVDAGEDDSPEA